MLPREASSLTCEEDVRSTYHRCEGRTVVLTLPRYVRKHVNLRKPNVFTILDELDGAASSVPGLDDAPRVGLTRRDDRRRSGGHPLTLLPAYLHTQFTRTHKQYTREVLDRYSIVGRVAKNGGSNVSLPMSEESSGKVCIRRQQMPTDNVFANAGCRLPLKMLPTWEAKRWNPHSTKRGLLRKAQHF
ncbi:hypothetical protein AAG570_005473 [Ranatra chinensis]|uniref:Uncharacterized protein n=1 Tax=Ranatra chinensis TaxID=642074 RepID=A0ABD0YCJ2_9HEMI